MITGGCLCRAVRYRSSEAPLVTRACWCRACQYLGAGGGTVNTCFRRAAVTIDGILGSYRSVADSGNVMHRGFCAACGTPVTSEAESRPHLVFIRSGTLDDPQIIRPAATIWTSQAPLWACIDPTIPNEPEQPPPVT